MGDDFDSFLANLPSAFSYGADSGGPSLGSLGGSLLDSGSAGADFSTGYNPGSSYSLFPDGVSGLGSLLDTQKPEASWWQSPAAGAGLQGLVGLAGGLFAGNQASNARDEATKAAALQFQQQMQLLKIKNDQEMAMLQYQLAHQYHAPSYAPRAPRFASQPGIAVSAGNSQAEGIRQSGANVTNAYDQLAQLMQAALLNKR